MRFGARRVGCAVLSLVSLAPLPATAHPAAELDGYLYATAGRTLSESSLYEVDPGTLAFRRLTEGQIIASMDGSDDEVVVSILHPWTQSIHRLGATGLREVATGGLYGAAARVSDEGMIAYQPMLADDDYDTSAIAVYDPQARSTRPLVRLPGRHVVPQEYMGASLLVESYDEAEGTCSNPITSSSLHEVGPDGTVRTIMTVPDSIGVVHANPAGVIAWSRWSSRTCGLDQGLLTSVEVMDAQGRLLRAFRGWMLAELSPDGTRVLLLRRTVGAEPLRQSNQAVLALGDVATGSIDILGRPEMPTTSFAWLSEPVE